MCRIRDCGFLRQQKQQKNGKPQHSRDKPRLLRQRQFTLVILNLISISKFKLSINLYAYIHTTRPQTADHRQQISKYFKSLIHILLSVVCGLLSIK